jgi:carbonic anhydrase
MPGPPVTIQAMTPGDQLPEQLEAGYRRFRATRFASERDRYRQLADEGQRPPTVVVACSDSRTAPETVFDAGPGEMFVVRNIAALVPPYEPDEHRHGASAALEYAVLGLDVASIVVLGHGRCGGVAAALAAAVADRDPLAPSDFVGAWISDLRGLARQLVTGEPVEASRRQHALELESVELSRSNLLTFPWIRSRHEAGVLSIHGAWFDIGSGSMKWLDQDGWVAASLE